MKLREFMPELTGSLEWLNSNSITRNDLIGNKPTIIHFWSVSCDSCKRGMENINNFYQEFNDQINIVTVHMPRSEKDADLDLVKQTAEEYRLTEPIVVDNDHTITNLFHNRYVPSFYLFDQMGKLRYLQSGRTGTVILKNRIHRLLKERNMSS